MMTPGYEDVLTARDRIAPWLKPTPLYPVPSLSELTGADIRVKHENHLPTCAFKVRGGVNLMTRLSGESKNRGVIASSTGNHGQSIGYASKLFGITAVVAVPESANPVKVAAMQQLGVDVRFVGESFDDCRQYAETAALESGMRYISSGDEPDLIAGVGTHTLEILEQWPEVDDIVVPVGGGSGAAGCCVVAKSTDRHIRVFGVQSESAPSAYLSWKEGKPVTAPIHTMAEGLQTGAPFSMPQVIMREHLDDFLLVDDVEIAASMLLLIEHTRNLIESAAASTLAAVLRYRHLFQGRRVVLILTGGNVTLDSLRNLLSTP